MEHHNIDSSFVWLHRLLDILTPIGTLSIIAYQYSINWNDHYLILGLIGGLSLVIFNQATGVYTYWRGRSLFAGTKKILKAWLLTWVSLVVVIFSLKISSDYSRVVIFSWVLITPVALFIYRYIIRTIIAQLRKKGWNNKRIAIIGAGGLGQRIASVLLNAEMLGCIPVAFYDDDTSQSNKNTLNIPVIGSIDDFLHETNIEERYDEIYIALPLRAEARIKTIINSLADSSLTVKFIPDFFSFDLLHSKIIDIAGIPIVSVYDTPLNSFGSGSIKKLEDILLSSLIITLISPLLIIISLVIKLTSTGPVIFKQKRYGINGQKIMVYKFRSMTVCENNNNITQATRTDPRITKFGSFLRRTSLDELPQFFNVIKGEMSIVGPRPHAVAHNEEYRKLIPKYMLRHLVKPGITGWAQIHGWRGETDTLDKMEKRIEFDLHYIENWSLWLDLRIITLTIFKGFINKNAY